MLLRRKKIRNLKLVVGLKLLLYKNLLAIKKQAILIHPASRAENTAYYTEGENYIQRILMRSKYLEIEIYTANIYLLPNKINV